MSGMRQRSIDPGTGPALILLAGIIGAAAPVVLIALGGAHAAAAIAVSVVVALAALGLAWRARRPDLATAAVRRAGPSSPPDQAAYFAQIVEALADPVLLIEGADHEDPNAHRFVFANVAAREILRIQRPEGPLAMVLRSPEVLRAVDEALFGGIVGEAVHETGGVQNRVWRARAAPVISAATSRSPVALLTLRDETDIRRGERTRADFLANASHELRTPLASLAGFIETLRGHARDDAVARDRFLTIMHEQAERMRRLIDDLMSLSRIELAEHIPPSGEIDLALAVMDVLDALAPLAEERGAAFSASLPPIGQALVAGDRDQAVQVVQNLAENALKYTSRGATVVIELEPVLSPATPAAGAGHFSLLTPDHAPSRSYLALRVRDGGPGIARRHLPRLTERFYRVEGQKSGERTGTGLGLAIVKHIMNRHRGGLTVESVEGSGSTFTALFPARDSARPVQEPLRTEEISA